MSTSPAGAGAAQPGHRDSAAYERTARRRAEVALFMRDHVLSLVSHDLRGPLNAIHSWAYVLERKFDAADAAAQRALGGIRTGVEQQVKLLEDIVDTTRADTRMLALERTSFALWPLIDETLGEVRSALAMSRDVPLDVDTALATEQLTGDRDRLAAAVWLMLAFAVESSAPGSPVTLATSADTTAWHVTVRFNVTPALREDVDVPHLLEAFALRQAQAPREAGRIAWVLALSKRVAEAHGGAFEQHDATDGNDTASLVLRVPLVSA
ncbi:sensor histidine kinase [Paraburkholderia sp.]|uniref:sensor histidine kinase n=1 Tax=Paraburkholderia sp. TaxID=1926495 RepID=UPI003D6FBF1B